MCLLPTIYILPFFGQLSLWFGSQRKQQSNQTRHQHREPLATVFLVFGRWDSERIQTFRARPLPKNSRSASRCLISLLRSPDLPKPLHEGICLKSSQDPSHVLGHIPESKDVGRCQCSLVVGTLNPKPLNSKP